MGTGLPKIDQELLKINNLSTMILALLHTLLLLIRSAYLSTESKIVLDVISVSDTHGWIYGHRHLPEYGDYGTLLSYIERTRQKALESEGRSVLAVDAGDLVEGTGLSDLTKVKGEKILEAASYIGFDLQTIGNHESYYKETTDYIRSKVEALFGDRYITTNVFMRDTDMPVGSGRYKYLVLPNGLRVLMLGFLFHTSPYDGVYTVPAREAIASQEITGVLEKYKYQTDLLVLACHIPTYDPEISEIVTELRAFYNQINYTIPIIIIAGHYHQIKNTYCMDGQDKQCYIVEGGCYLRFMQHVTYEFKPMTYSHEGNTYTGYQFSSVDYSLPYNFTSESLAKRFNLTTETFMTENGAILSNKIAGWVADLNLTTFIGYNKHYYSMFKNATDQDSIFNLWLNGAIPAVFYPTRSTPCLPFPTISSGTARYDFFPGNVTRDDCIAIQPSWQTMSTIRGLTANLIACLFSVKNGLAETMYPLPEGLFDWEDPHLINYQTTLDPFTLNPNKCYDLLTTIKSAESFLALLQEGGACYEEGSGPYSVSPYYDQNGQEVNAIDVLLKYVEMYMPNLDVVSPYILTHDLHQADKDFMMMMGIISFAIYITLIMVALISFCVKPPVKTVSAHRRSVDRTQSSSESNPSISFFDTQDSLSNSDIIT